ncbi:hypothetical protein HYW76_04800 [Candidatus Pacearchaeota archaeon]|nr:hypothetical protein [Candidatus Pacearchaeota archaeon]
MEFAIRDRISYLEAITEKIENDIQTKSGFCKQYSPEVLRLLVKVIKTSIIKNNGTARLTKIRIHSNHAFGLHELLTEHNFGRLEKQENPETKEEYFIYHPY